MNYVKDAVRTVNKNLTKKELIINGALGLCGESGEVADVIKKYAFQGHVLNLDRLKDELGDVFWYIALLCDVCGFTFEEIQEHNINKLKKRYPEGFEEEKSVNRNGELEELPVIPKFVADWIEEVKPDNSLRVAFEYISKRKRDDYDDELAFWVEEGNSETLARAWLDGYTVESEDIQ